MKTLLIIIAIFLSSSGIGQTLTNGSCYRKNIIDKKSVFTKTLYYPQYKGKVSLDVFLINQINLRAIAKTIADSLTIFLDSVKVKFIISRTGQMSNLSAEGENKVLTSEIRNAFINSACHWAPGGTERHLSVWYTGTIYFKLDRAQNSGSIKVFAVSSDL